MLARAPNPQEHAKWIAEGNQQIEQSLSQKRRSEEDAEVALIKLQAIARGRKERATSDKVSPATRASGTRPNTPPLAPPPLRLCLCFRFCHRAQPSRRAGAQRNYGRPALPPSMDGAALEGWLVKRGSGYPHKWQRRYFVFLAATSTLHYFAADGSEGAAYQSKGEVVISLIKPHPSEPLGLSFEVASSSRAGGKLVNSGGKVRLSLGGSFSGNVSANKTRSLLARAPNAQEHARWLAVSTEASSPHLAKTASFSGHL